MLSPQRRSARFKPIKLVVTLIYRLYKPFPIGFNLSSTIRDDVNAYYIRTVVTHLRSE